MSEKSKYHFLRIPIVSIAIGILFFACENKLDTIRKVTYDPKAPNEVIKDFKMFYTDSGFAKIEIYAAIAETYTKPEAVTKFKDGVKVNFFTDEGVINSVLTAKYGEYNMSKMLVFVKDSVRLLNLNSKQQLETEQLFWNQKDSSIYTKSNAIVRSPKGVFYGEGLKTRQDFSTYEFIKPYGNMQMGN